MKRAHGASQIVFSEKPAILRATPYLTTGGLVTNLGCRRGLLCSATTVNMFHMKKLCELKTRCEKCLFHKDIS